MIDYKKAILKIKINKIKINSEKILSINSINRVASCDVYSPNNYPSANNSSFDGYAINSKETKNLIEIRTRQYAKRQFTWARGQMTSWQTVNPKKYKDIADNLSEKWEKLSR